MPARRTSGVSRALTGRFETEGVQILPAIGNVVSGAVSSAASIISKTAEHAAEGAVEAAGELAEGVADTMAGENDPLPSRSKSSSAAHMHSTLLMIG